MSAPKTEPHDIDLGPAIRAELERLGDKLDELIAELTERRDAAEEE